MELLLLPSVTEGALVLVLAAVFIGGDKIFGMPVLADLLCVSEDRGLPSVILPVVGVHAYVALVIILPVRTPDSLKMENVEVHIWLKFLNQLDRELPLIVCKGAELTIIALSLSVEVGATEFGFVFVRVVKFLDPVVRLVAILFVGAFLVIVYVPALF